ncbi:MAG: thioredoxin family protein [Candidatus Bathyarchaeota archaeon]|nr:thioredoxin family protein [Candidatus Bathyarchaeota archaeon]
MSSIIDIQVDDWDEKILGETRPVVVEYWHHKCPVCIEMKPIYEAQPEKYGETVSFTRMNLLVSKENRVLAIRNGVRSTPTFIVYCEGRPVGQIIGQRKPDEFSSELKLIIDNADKCLMSTPVEE